MSVDEFQDKLNQALSTAIAGDADLDDVDQALADARERLDEIRVLRGGS